MGFKLDKSSEKRMDFDDGPNLCWKRFFKKLTVAQGYPIPSRPDGFDGLQIPLHQAAKILQARRIDRFHSRHIVKGYSTALYPTRVSPQDNFIAWHFIENEDGSRLSYIDPRLGEGEDEKRTRHAVYRDIYISPPLQVTDYEATLEKLELQGGTTNFKLAGTVAFCKRLRGESLKTGRSEDDQDWVKTIENVGKNDKLVLLYDTQDKRAWLVDTYSALMHLFRASLLNDREGRSKGLYWHSEDKPTPGHPTVEQLFSDNAFKLAKLDYLEELEEEKKKKHEGEHEGEHEEEPEEDLGESSSVPFTILKSPKFCSQELRRQSDGPASKGTEADTAFYVADRISDLVEGLEKIQDLVANSNKTGPKPAVGISTSSATVLEGYDFWDVARLGGAATLEPKSARLHEVAKGWLEFTRNIKAVALFGTGFHNILRPVVEIEKGSCKHCFWNIQMPRGKDILALTVADLEYLHREEWRTTDTRDRTVRMLFPWKDPAGCFNPCEHRIFGTRALCSSPVVRIKPFMPLPELKKKSVYSKVKDIARKIRHPSTKLTQHPPASRGTNFCRSGAILLGVPDSDLLSGKIPKDDTTTPTESTAHLEVVAEGQRAPSAAFSENDDRDTRASATSPSETQESSMTIHTPTTYSDETEIVTPPATITTATTSRAKQKERGHTGNTLILTKLIKDGQLPPMFLIQARGDPRQVDHRRVSRVRWGNQILSAIINSALEIPGGR
ncbi:hypothetical protein V8F06_002047 [Rhypophila decipiens]